ncbi:stearoyl-CoA desaturase [Suhomyces tanzawaensis NRRL Y-17324]|uniref:Acyl-CoA desaturase n=1 Tax=Suhomyces tanzawaensis NRRL Y-17324 TaxID=984487 RepID=A0A1E4SNG0_9ASCO|nr:stearoyl-CoA desaturase [Suhomyces tanzawaensis NRRL Y-17324]ODV80957.1 stearoyl-CoA desaturase [Suhomyces tanzawaensis NRRL Y-17324]
MESLEVADVTKLNALAAGTNKKTPRIVAAGLGGRLMGTRDLVKITAEQVTQDSLESIAEKDAREKEHFTKNKHISEKPWTLSNFHQHLNWLNMILVVGFPAFGVYSAITSPPQWKTAVLGFTLYILSGLSITAGYHRLYSHKSYSAALPVRLFFAFFGAGSIEGSIKWWSHSHRIHHRYTDTPRDPYDARRGFWFSHMGWMLTKANPKNRARADISDLSSDWVVSFQHRHYLVIMLLSAFVLPTLIAGIFWGDYWGGFIYGGILKTFVIQQATFCVNSLAHWIGLQPFDDRRTPRDHFLTAFITFGEGYHNFHHEFPSDYRNALKWYQYDPTKVVIWALCKVGLAWNLQTFSQNAIEQGLVQQQQKKIDRMRNKLNWGATVDNLPVWDRSEFNARAKEEGLIIISGIVHNVKAFIKEHPGGQALVRASLGKDATKAFNGAVYAHSNAAHNLLANMRIAVIRDGDINGNTFALQQEFLDKEKLA